MISKVETHPTTLEELSAMWQTPLNLAACESGDSNYLVPVDSGPVYSPECHQFPLMPLTEEVSQLPYLYPPEQVLPFTVSVSKAAEKLDEFIQTIWFAPRDFTLANLQSRLQRVYLPMWLVDSRVQATWQAEIGVDYEVISHQDQFDENKGGWRSKEVRETRLNWEPRAGRLDRVYDNITAPALEAHQQLQKRVGTYDLKTAQPYHPDAIANSLVRMPNRLPKDAWGEVLPSLQTTAAEECRQACQAKHIRDFRWQATYHDQNWTLLLLPLYTTYYLDDDQNPHQIIIHGQTARLHGLRRASMKRAQQIALYLGGMAVMIFVLTLLLGGLSLFYSSLTLIAIIALGIALLVGLAALVPLFIAWQTNRKIKKGDEFP